MHEAGWKRGGQYPEGGLFGAHCCPACITLLGKQFPFNRAAKAGLQVTTGTGERRGDTPPAEFPGGDGGVDVAAGEGGPAPDVGLLASRAVRGAGGDGREAGADKGTGGGKLEDRTVHPPAWQRALTSLACPCCSSSPTSILPGGFTSVGVVSAGRLCRCSFVSTNCCFSRAGRTSLSTMAWQG